MDVLWVDHRLTDCSVLVRWGGQIYGAPRLWLHVSPSSGLPTDFCYGTFEDMANLLRREIERGSARYPLPETEMGVRSVAFEYTLA